ncbi:MAG TPA: calcium-binding protein [Solirubrobacterales bacterium]|nr:calcium-binding protein [Solirubrobacterales bacterium]
MRRRIWKSLGTLASLAAVAAIAPLSASAEPGVTASVWTVHGGGAVASASVNVLTLSDAAGVDNRISAWIGSTDRLVLSAPEGLGDPDGSGANCSLDNAKPGQWTAQEVSCAAGYIGAIVGDLGRGADTFDADPHLSVLVGAVVDGQRRPLAGGPGRDRLVGGAAADLLDGGGRADSIVGAGGQDFLIGGPGADNLSGGGGADTLLGLGGPDRLSGGGGKDLCRGGGGSDAAKSCETARGIP